MPKLVTVVLAAAALVAAGCGGGGGGSSKTTSVNTRGYSTSGPRLSRAEFRTKLQAIVQGDLNAAKDKLATGGPSNPDAGTAAAEMFRAAANKIAALNPPPELQQANKTLVNTLSAFADQLDKLVKATKDKDKAALQEVTRALPALQQQLVAAQDSIKQAVGGG